MNANRFYILQQLRASRVTVQAVWRWARLTRPTK